MKETFAEALFKTNGLLELAVDTIVHHSEFKPVPGSPIDRMKSRIEKNDALLKGIKRPLLTPLLTPAQAERIVDALFNKIDDIDSSYELSNLPEERKRTLEQDIGDIADRYRLNKSGGMDFMNAARMARIAYLLSL